MSHQQSQNGQQSDVRKKIGMTPPKRGTFQQSRAKLKTMLKTNQQQRKATQNATRPKAK